MTDDPRTPVPTVGDVFASRLRAFRKDRDLSVPALAARCADLGVPELTVPSITNLERPADAARARRKVSVEEWLALAIALDVPPLALIAPAGEAAAVAVTPKRVMPTGEMIDWLTPNATKSLSLRTRDPLAARLIGALGLARRFSDEARLIASQLRPNPTFQLAPDFAEGSLRASVDALLNARNEIARRGEVEPAIPGDMAPLIEAELARRQQPGVSDG